MNEHIISLHMRNRNPKPDAPTYHLETVAQIFDMLTEENFENFFRDFQAGIKATMAIKRIAQSMADAGQIEQDEARVSMSSFTWVDDYKPPAPEDIEEQRLISEEGFDDWARQIDEDEML